MGNEVEQESGEFTPIDEMVISDLDTLKVVADPFRMSILQYLHDPGTVKQVAKKLNRPPTKLYYHFNLLEKHGIITVVETRLVSGIVEKHYQCAAKSYRVRRSLISPGAEDSGEGFDLVLSSIFGDARNDLRESIVAGVVELDEEAPLHRRPLINQAVFRLTLPQAEDLYRRLLTLLEDYKAMDEDETGQSDKMPYKLLLLLHPSSRERLAEESGEE